MGTFAGHIVPGLAFIFLGLWHTFNTISTYKSTATSFRSRAWYPLKTPFTTTIKHLELLLILSFSLLAITMQIFDYPLLHLSFKPDNFEHATMFVHLTIYASVALAAEFTPSPDALDGLVGVLGVSAFAQELFLLHFHSTDHVGLEGHYHWLLQLIATVSLLTTICSMGFPCSFPAALVRSASILFQGCWFIDMGFVLWGPGPVPSGCSAAAASPGGHDVHGAVVCVSEEALGRAKAMANLQFSWILAGVSMMVSALCLKPSRNSMEYRRLGGAGGVGHVAVRGGLVPAVEAENLKQTSVV